MSDCMSNVCGMDGNYCSSCAKDRRIEELEATIKQVRDVRDDLATQTLNGHAVKMLDKALEQK